MFAFFCIHKFQHKIIILKPVPWLMSCEVGYSTLFVTGRPSKPLTCSIHHIIP